MTKSATFLYFENVLKKLRIQLRVLKSREEKDIVMDLGLRHLTGRDSEYSVLISTQLEQVQPRTIYQYTDDFLCTYNSLLLPGDSEQVLFIGPYTRMIIDETKLMELAEQLSVPPKLIEGFKECYTGIPVISDESFYYAMLTSFGEFLWGSSNFELVDIDMELKERPNNVLQSQEEQEKADILVSMRLLEERYKWENELMNTIARGQLSRAEKMIPSGTKGIFKQRTADPVRNMKNYAVICNTLMRKAAERGGVHPFHLDRMSNAYALRIESQTNEEAVGSLIIKMMRDYGHLVRKHAMKDYSPQVRRAVLLIDSELFADLNLNYIAQSLNMSPSYLSTIFKKETGRSITAFITQRRMDHAAELLRSTSLQIQNIAVYCGISDANYFSKLFKKIKGVSPMQYRNTPEIR